MSTPINSPFASTSATLHDRSLERVADRTNAVIALFAGLLLILSVGFAPLAAIHNAAHDTRHTAAFPCH